MVSEDLRVSANLYRCLQKNANTECDFDRAIVHSNDIKATNQSRITIYTDKHQPSSEYNLISLYLVCVYMIHGGQAVEELTAPSEIWRACNPDE